MLKYQVETIPEGLEAHYTEQNGKFILDVEGQDTSELDSTKSELATTKTKLSEFRQTNSNLMKQIKDSGGNVDDDFKIDIDAAINEALAPIKEKNTSLMDENAKLQTTLEEVVLSDKVKDIAITHGVHEGALSDVVSRAKNVFIVKDGKTIPKDKRGSRDADGNVLTPEKWIEGLSETAAHLFKSSQGSGAIRPMGGQIQSDRSSVNKIADGLKKL